MDKVLIVEAKLKGLTLKMYGENHLSIDNSFYQSLKLTSGLIFVEHSTTHSIIQQHEQHLFKKHAKGSEWIFYTQYLEKNPNLVLFDTRNEHGYMNAFEETHMCQLADILSTATGPEIIFFIDNCLKFLTTFRKNKDWFNVFDNYYDNSSALLESQFKLIVALLKLNKKNKDILIMGSHPISQIIIGIANTFVLNMKKIASVSVDINLLRILNSVALSEIKEVMLFAGQNHVLRMLNFLNLTKVNTSLITDEMESLAKIDVEGDLHADKQLLDFINHVL